MNKVFLRKDDVQIKFNYLFHKIDPDVAPGSIGYVLMSMIALCFDKYFNNTLLIDFCPVLCYINYQENKW